MRKTNHASYCIKTLPDGCKFCVKGQKLVLFISGKCIRNCVYCSLSRKRKNKDIIWANERKCNNTKDAINEALESHSKGAGITGGDPLIVLDRTINYAKALKKKFGEKFHIHIYLPTKLVTKEKLKKLSKCIDEVRFHPDFLANQNTNIGKELEKIKLASFFWKKEQIGLELPILPEKSKEIFDFIIKAKDFIGFTNLNELEISETNFNYIIKNYKLNEDTYTIKDSKKEGLKILKACGKAEKTNLKINIHLCTADTKNLYQYKNRLKLHNILPYGYKTKEGTVRYFAIYANKNRNKRGVQKLLKELKKFKYIHPDYKRNRILFSEKIAPKISALNQHKIAKVEEFPTYDSTLIEFEYL